MNDNSSSSNSSRGGNASAAASGSDPAAADAVDPAAVDVYSYVIVVLAAIGVVVNVSSLIILSRKRHCSIFVNLLRLLGATDLMVVVGCALLYSLPDLSYSYLTHGYPYMLPWLLPVTQSAMMASVYLTIFMSYERYIRIVHSSRFRASSFLTEENFKYYVGAVIICPNIFYIPRFFELRTVYTAFPAGGGLVDCMAAGNGSGGASNVAAGKDAAAVNAIMAAAVNGGGPVDFPGNRTEGGDFPSGLNSSQMAAAADLFSKMTMSFGFAACNNATNDNTMMLASVEPTELRNDPLYYQIYVIGLNTVFATVFPIVTLFYFNICTVLALRRLGRENSVAVESRVDTATTNSSSLTKLKKKSKKKKVSIGRNGGSARNKQNGLQDRDRDSAGSRLDFLRRKRLAFPIGPRSLPARAPSSVVGAGAAAEMSSTTVMTRARSESQGDYSPQMRNDVVLSRLNGKKAPLGGGNASSNDLMRPIRHRRNRRSHLRRVNSAPEKFPLTSGPAASSEDDLHPSPPSSSAEAAAAAASPAAATVATAFPLGEVAVDGGGNNTASEKNGGLVAAATMGKGGIPLQDLSRHNHHNHHRKPSTSSPPKTRAPAVAVAGGTMVEAVVIKAPVNTSSLNSHARRIRLKAYRIPSQAGAAATANHHQQQRQPGRGRPAAMGS